MVYQCTAPVAIRSQVGVVLLPAVAIAKLGHLEELALRRLRKQCQFRETRSLDRSGPFR